MATPSFSLQFNLTDLTFFLMSQFAISQKISTIFIVQKVLERQTERQEFKNQRKKDQTEWHNLAIQKCWTIRFLYFCSCLECKLVTSFFCSCLQCRLVTFMLLFMLREYISHVFPSLHAQSVDVQLYLSFSSIHAQSVNFYFLCLLMIGGADQLRHFFFYLCLECR